MSDNKPTLTEQKLRMAEGKIAIVLIAECPKCHFTWVTRVTQPKKCPQCFKRLMYKEIA